MLSARLPWLLFLTAAGLRLLLVSSIGPASFWDSASYVELAKALRHEWTLPPIGMRSLGYPLFLALTAGPDFDLTWSVRAQQALGIFSTLLLYATGRRLGLGTRGAFLATLLYMSSLDILFMELCLYSETLVIFLVLSTVCLLLKAIQEEAGARLWFIVGVCASCAALVRPVFQLLIVIPAIWAGVEHLRYRRLGPRQFLAFILPAVLLLGSYSLYGLEQSGRFRYAIGKGFSSLNYVGRPEIYSKLPEDLDWLRKVYMERTAGESLPTLGWTVMLQPVLEARIAQGLSSDDWDDAAFDTFKRSVRAVPGAYFGVWIQVLRQFLSEHFVWYGLFGNQDVPQTAENSLAPSSAYPVVRLAEALWRLIQGPICLLALLAGIALLPAGNSRQRSCAVGLAAIVFVHVLANTALEPSPGQARYRMPWSGCFVLLAFIFGLNLLNWLRRSMPPGAGRR